MSVLRIYIAGKTHQYKRVQKVQQMCRARGHIITYDWTKNVAHHGPDSEHSEPSIEQQCAYAKAGLMGVVLAKLVIALGHPKLCGTFVEIGAALGAPPSGFGKERQVWLVGMEQPSVFWHLPQVTALANDNDIPHELDAIAGPFW